MNKYITSAFFPEPKETVTIFVLLEISPITFSGITSHSAEKAPAFSNLLNFKKRLCASSLFFPTALNPPIHVDFLGTKPRCPITGTSSLANISTIFILLGVITASAPFSKASNAPLIISSEVTNLFNTSAAVKNRFFDPSLTCFTLKALQIIMSNPAFSAASASSSVLAVT